eukprot:1198415-Lingulodinium_polyedra.AAC.1
MVSFALRSLRRVPPMGRRVRPQPTRVLTAFQAMRSSGSEGGPFAAERAPRQTASAEAWTQAKAWATV